MNSAFPGMQWGNFGGAPAQRSPVPQQPQQQRPPVQPQPPQPAPQAPEIDFADGLNNPVEMALHPNLDLIGMEAAGPFLEAGSMVNFRTLITRGDRPGWQQEVAGQVTINPDGSGAQTRCTMGPPSRPVMQLNEQHQNNSQQGSSIQGQVVPARNPGTNERLEITPSGDGVQIQGTVDGWQVFEQSQQTRDPQGGGAVTMHSGTLGGVNFQRVLRPAPDGSKAIQGHIGNLSDTGKVTQAPDGRTHVTRDIGPYHLEQDIWIIAGQPALGQGFFYPLPA